MLMYRQQQHLCNKQILKLLDTSITIGTTGKLGLPLRVFCLEIYHNKERLYDQMKLMNYDLKIHDHIYLKFGLDMKNELIHLLKVL
jgi:hypothetical protein